MKRYVGLKSGAPRQRVTVLAASILVTLLIHAQSYGVELENAITLGYDSFIDRFTILEEDTAEVVHELYAGLNNRISFQSSGTKALLRNHFRIGNQTLDDNLGCEISFVPLTSIKVDLRSDVRFKHFLEGSDYTFGNDYLQSNSFLKVKKSFNRDYHLNIRSRFEIVDYDEKTDFDYDYVYFDSGLELEGGSVLENLFRFGAYGGYKSTPDTTALSYRRMLADLEGQLTLKDGISLHIAVAGDRRDYNEDVRSSYWTVFSYAYLLTSALDSRSYYFTIESELTLYDEQSDIYFNTHFLRGSFRVAFPAGEYISLFLEPRYAQMFCSGFEEERYWEGSVVCGLDILGTNNMWLTASYEPGFRNYILSDNELYSDFYLNRLSMMGSINVPGSTTLSILATHDPERHTRRDDDFSITLVSISLTKKF